MGFAVRGKSAGGGQREASGGPVVEFVGAEGEVGEDGVEDGKGEGEVIKR